MEQGANVDLGHAFDRRGVLVVQALLRLSAKVRRMGQFRIRSAVLAHGCTLSFPDAVDVSVMSSIASRMRLLLALFRRDAPGIEQQNLLPDGGKIVLHAEVVEVRVLGKDVLQELPQGGDVPLPLADLVEQPAFRLGRIHLEDLIERTARRDDPQLAVQHHQRLADRGNDALGELAGRLQLHLLRRNDSCCCLSESSNCFIAVMSANVITTPSITLSAVR